MKEKIALHLEGLISRYPALSASLADIEAAFYALRGVFESGGKLLVCGNGGSASDAEHIVGELMKGFLKKRPVHDDALGEDARFLQGALSAISLCGHLSLSTAFANDVSPLYVFAQQVYGYGRKGDVFLGISTSGNSPNVCAALSVAKRIGLKTIALTGSAGGQLKETADITICAPSSKTAEVQEFHLPIYHCLCAMLEEAFFEE